MTFAGPPESACVWDHFVVPANVAGLGRASLLEELFKVSSGKFVRASLLEGTLKVSSGKFVGSPGELCGAREIPCVWDSLCGYRKSCRLGRASLLEELLKVSSGKFVRASLLEELLKVSSGKFAGSLGDPCGAHGFTSPRARGRFLGCAGEA